MDRGRLVVSSVPVSLYGEGRHPAPKLLLKSHRVVIITQRPQQNSRRPPIALLQNSMVPQGECTMRGARERTWRLSPILSHTEEFTLAESMGPESSRSPSRVHFGRPTIDCER
jgi:hypothetical protein